MSNVWLIKKIKVRLESACKSQYMHEFNPIFCAFQTITNETRNTEGLPGSEIKQRQRLSGSAQLYNLTT